MNNQERPTKYWDDKLISDLHKVASELGRCPVADDMRGNDSCADPETYIRYFGSWHNALHEAGLEPKYNQDEDKELKEVVQWMV